MTTTVQDEIKASPISGIVRKYWLDVFLLSATAIAFGLFARGTLHFEQNNKIGSHIAVITSGHADRKKKAGISEFTPLETGATIHNLDVLWVGKGQSAALQFVDNVSELKIPEKTLAVVKSPFKNRNRHANESVLLIKDGMVINRSEKERQNHSLEIPRVSAQSKNARGAAGTDPSTPDANTQGQELLDELVTFNPYPKPGTIIVTHDPLQVTLRLGWNSTFSGFLAIQRLSDEKVIYIPLKVQNAANAILKQNEAYLWQIISPEKKLLLGPYPFELKQWVDSGVSDWIYGPDSKKIEVHW